MYNFPTEVTACLWTTTMALRLWEFLMVRTLHMMWELRIHETCTALVIALYFTFLTFVITKQWFRDEWCQFSPFIKNGRFKKKNNNNNNAGYSYSTGVTGFYRPITLQMPQKQGSLVSRCNASILLSTCVAAHFVSDKHKNWTT